MFDNQAKPNINKATTMKEIAKYLSENPKTDIGSIINVIKHRLRHEGIIGKQSKSHGGGIMTYNVEMNVHDALLINECIYDLLFSRVITPGINLDNLDLPFVHVSNQEELKKHL